MEPTAESQADADFFNRFGGIARLYGRDALQRLRAAHVCVVGVGGVGSWTVEALARSGVGEITMIDLDDVCVTNTNRQLHAMEGQIGRAKVDVIAERVMAIQPGCRVHALCEYFTEANAGKILSTPFSFVVDAIDKVSNKCLLLASCLERSISVLTVGGAGGKRDGTVVRISDLAISGQDPLLRQVRRRLRQEHGLSIQPNVPSGIPCVYSPERPVFPWANGTACATQEPGSDLTLDCASGFGTATFVTGAFGFAAAGEVVRRIALGE
jgi:tRNA A37 threonylcarbamoyladenosine dehydratase